MALTVLEKLDARVPQWNLEHLTARNCPFCGAQNEPLLQRPDMLEVAFCCQCGSWYVDKIPPASDVAPLYESYYTTHRPVDLSDRRVSEMLKKARTEGEANWQLRALLNLYAGHGPMRILDVGCGFGQFLLEARSLGADVVGCDLSEDACSFANEKLGITVYRSEISSCSSAVGKVDAVVMRDFIEHPFEPMIDIQAAVDLLTPGGLLMVHTPNGGQAGWGLETASNWVGFRVDLEHFQYLTPQAVNWLSCKFNLQIERLDTSGYPGLKGIDSFPRREQRSVSLARRVSRGIPGVQGVCNVLRRLKAAMLGGQPDPRLGAYHLFFVLRKR